MNNIISVFLILVLLSMSNTAFSQDQTIYNTSWKKDGPFIGASVGLFGLGYLIDKKRAPITELRLGNLNANDVWAFDRSATSNFSASASDASDLLSDGAFLLPFTLLFSKKARSEYQSVLIMYSEVLAVRAGITNVVKQGVGRLRPYAYNPNAPLELKLSNTTRRSFFSGHVSHVASLSFFTAKVYSDLYPESKFRHVVWAGAITAPAITAYLRYKAGRHYPSDVIVGYGIGAIVGYLIPNLHKNKAFSICGSENGLGMTFTIK